MTPLLLPRGALSDPGPSNARHQPRAKRVGWMLKLGASYRRMILGQQRIGVSRSRRLRTQSNGVQVIPLNLLFATHQLVLVVFGADETAGQCVSSSRNHEQQTLSAA